MEVGPVGSRGTPGNIFRFAGAVSHALIEQTLSVVACEDNGINDRLLRNESILPLGYAATDGITGRRSNDKAVWDDLIGVYQRLSTTSINVRIHVQDSRGMIDRGRTCHYTILETINRWRFQETSTRVFQ